MASIIPEASIDNSSFTKQHNGFLMKTIDLQRKTIVFNRNSIFCLMEPKLLSNPQRNTSEKSTTIEKQFLEEES